ncbi:MAG: helix-turn-helix transcriptional regulator [Clostridia bacterium]|nr:helix-turn-helix transcriptional regulator [Clostridia bacterium]
MNNTSFEVHTHKNKRLPFYLHKNIGRSHPGITLSTWHPAVEILFCKSGNGSVLCNMINYNLTVGDIFIINSNYQHTISTDTAVKYDCLIIDETFFEENDIDIKNTIFTSSVNDDTARKLFSKVTESFDNDGLYKTATIRSSILNLLVYLCKNYSASGTLYSEAGASCVEISKIAIGYINAHFTEQLTLDMLAKETGVNKYHLCHEFKRVTSHTVFSYINLCRCEKAAQILSRKDSAIHDACYGSGFESPAYFAKTFKKYYGVSPSAYKKAKKESRT